MAIPYRLDSKSIGPAANGVSRIIMRYSKENPCNKNVIIEETGFTLGQVNSIIKYMRRCSEENLERYIKYYPISSKKGYFFPKTFEEFAPCYITLMKWAHSLLRTIEPMRKKMEEAGIDWQSQIPEPEEFSNYLDEIEEIDKDNSWFMEEN